MNWKEKLLQFQTRIKFVKWRDILSVFPACLAAAIAPFFRLYHKRIWLICERKSDARDNGYWFYKYVCENHPEIEAVYAIDFRSPDYVKVKQLGKVIPFGSFLHWLYYFAAEKNISTQKEGKPNAAICFILEVYLNLRQNRVFLQHGIIQSDLKWLYCDLTKMNLFLCAAQKEYSYIKERFGYPENALKLTGLCRYDALMNTGNRKRQILVMPTMRKWLARISTDTDKYEGTRVFEESQYYRVWTSFLNDAMLHAMLDKYNIDLIFYPHAALQKYVSQFHSENPRIVIAAAANYDVQELMKESMVMITDYSSVHFDFAYMGKPVLYYQFDYDLFREAQYQEGYFSYKDDGFGPVVEDKDALLAQLENILRNDCVMSEVYKQHSESFYAYRDNKNCERTFEAIQNM